MTIADWAVAAVFIAALVGLSGAIRFALKRKLWGAALAYCWLLLIFGGGLCMVGEKLLRSM